MDKERVLLVGFRRNAMATAKQLGFDIVLWDHKPPPALFQHQFVSVIIEPFPDIEQAVALNVINAIKKLNIKHIVATTEKSVLPAAKLGSLLGLNTPEPITALCCRDKLTMKLCAQHAGIAMTPFEIITPKTTAEQIVAKLGLPLILKARSLSGSRDMLYIDSIEKLRSTMKVNLIAEQHVIGVEMSIESFVKNGDILFNNITEYYEQHAINILPAKIDKATYLRILDLNKRVIKAMGIQTGMTHLEFYVTANDILFGEIALRPPGGYIMELLSLSYGFNAWECYFRLITEQDVSPPYDAKSYSAAWIIHPGAGVVDKVQGFDEIKNIPSIHEMHSRIKKGALIAPRGSSGEYCAHVLFAAPDKEKLIQDIEQAKNLLKIQFQRSSLMSED